MTDRTAIFVLGMHRSGTSALARTLSLLGAALPARLLPAGPGNETGHWEPQAAVALHDRMLAAAGTSVNGPAGPSGAWLEGSSARAFSAEMRDLVETEFGAAPLFVFKDPRTALVFPLWRRVLDAMGIRCVAAIMSRNPIEVARSMAARQGLAEPGQFWSMDRGGLLWLRYTLAAERHTRDMARSFCSYDGLLADWRAVAARLSADLGLQWPRAPEAVAPEIEAFLSADRRHQRADPDLGGLGGIWSGWIAPLQAELLSASRGGKPDPVLFDRISRSFATSSPDAGPSAPASESAERPTGVVVASAPRQRRPGRRLACLVVTEFLLAPEHGGRVRRLLEEARRAEWDVGALVHGPLSREAVAALEALAARHDMDVEPCDPGGAAVEPAHMRAGVELYRCLRGRRLDAILVQDHGGLCHASLVARRTGLAFRDTPIAVLALGSSALRRERERRFPETLVPIAVEHLERQAVELADLVLEGAPEVAAWMERAGWRPAGGSPARDADLLGREPAAFPPIEVPESPSPAPDTTIVIPHFEQTRLLEQNLVALARQTDRRFTVLVVDDGSRSEAAETYLRDLEQRHAALGLRLIRQENRYLGAARNAGIRASDTEFVILLDDDNVARPEMVERLRRAILTSEADVVTCGISRFHDPAEPPGADPALVGSDQVFPGGPLLLGAVHNCFGDASGIYRRRVFDEVGFFHELRGVTFEDWQMHLRVVAAGRRLVSLPEPLVWYRVRPDSMLRTTDRYDNARVIASIVRDLPAAALEPLCDYLMGSEIAQRRIGEPIDPAGEVGSNALTVALARLAALAEEADRSGRHAANLEAVLRQRDRDFREVETYARSLEAALAECRSSLASATEYAASLERARTEAEALIAALLPAARNR